MMIDCGNTYDYEWINGWMDGWMDEWMDGYIDKLQWMNAHF